MVLSITSLFLKILCFFQLGGWAWAYIRNGPNAAASIAPTLIRPWLFISPIYREQHFLLMLNQNGE